MTRFIRSRGSTARRMEISGRATAEVIVMKSGIRILIFITIFFLFLTVSSGRTEVATQPAAVNVVPVKEITIDPNSAVWTVISSYISKMLLQDLVTPKLLAPSTKEVQVKAISNGIEIAFRLEWLDETQNDLPGPGRFVDGCAIQLPSKTEAEAPVSAMGQKGKTVDISYWRADWQAIVEGRPDNINAIYPNAAVDHYPSEAKPLENDRRARDETALRYAPASALGNRRVGPRDQPVEDLVGEGVNNLSPAPNAVSKGKGVRTDKGWAVVISRPLPKGFSASRPTKIAFAIWEGSHSEVGARKMRTGWVPLIMK